MEGILCVPPDRGPIIGRAVWKPRYVVLGNGLREPQIQSGLGRSQSNRSSTPARMQIKVNPDTMYLSIYKSKEDWEPALQVAVSSITDCQVQMLAHRKQGPILPTMVVNVAPDPATEKMRKRRSSRTAGLTTGKDSIPSTLLFRAGEDSHSHLSLHEWARFLQQLIRPSVVPEGQAAQAPPLSPITPASPSFVNPFSPRSGELQHRPSSGSASSRPSFHPMNFTPIFTSRERPVTLVDTPSLRSKRSDVSSQTSSMNPSLGYQHYTAMFPADLPSPATTVGEYQGEFIEGWTSAQGRSSVLSSPVRGRDNSVGSQSPAPLPPPMLDPTSPPGPRETILDRAFQMRCIPGSERDVPGEEKLSSLARFDALMRELDDKRKKREADEARSRSATLATSDPATERPGLKSEWDVAGASSPGEDIDEEDEDSDVPEVERDSEDDFMIPSSTRKALEFITGRNELALPQKQSSRQPIRVPLMYNADALNALSSGGGSSSRPQTGYSHRSRPSIGARTQSQPQMTEMLAAYGSPLMGVPEGHPEASFEEGSLATAMNSATSTPLQHSHRHSTSSGRPLSFTEFTKRLSSTSSLLLVQTNNSTGSSRGSSNIEADGEKVQPQQRPQSPLQGDKMVPRSAGSPPQRSIDREVLDKRCGWRGSVGVFGGAEGGFL
ncbi:hypothetical protein QBC32DRAFT_166967 [Pseudoneurospora amorphoporcata]|uniref:Uncharacterized protein n=1 Tax=Pseudoneurospora amorphoporcata TaxID=241081 RepID=A0AAN6NWN0_9PEZI|nr:hypothetical protein QBC32DRAFT_166967 [Pseudoneurospora amorphoporcata]